jgi:hypothetical protein
VRISVARQVYWGTTGQRPPAPTAKSDG